MVSSPTLTDSSAAVRPAGWRSLARPVPRLRPAPRARTRSTTPSGATSGCSAGSATCSTRPGTPPPSPRRRGSPTSPTSGRRWTSAPIPIVMMDPPEHTQFRRLVSRGFTPRRVSELEPQIRCVRRRTGRPAARGRVGRRRGRALQAAPQHGGGALPWRPPRGPSPLRRVDRRHRGRQRQRGLRGCRRCRRRSGGVLRRADRTSPSRAGRRHGVRTAGRRSSRRDRDAAHPRLRVHDGDRRQRHHHGPARAVRPNCSPAIATSGSCCSTTRASCLEPSTSSSGSRRRSRTWPAPPPAPVRDRGFRPRRSGRDPRRQEGRCWSTRRPTAIRANSDPPPKRSTSPGPSLA